MLRVNSFWHWDNFEMRHAKQHKTLGLADQGFIFLPPPSAASSLAFHVLKTARREFHQTVRTIPRHILAPMFECVECGRQIAHSAMTRNRDILEPAQWNARNPLCYPFGIPYFQCPIGLFMYPLKTSVVRSGLFLMLNHLTVFLGFSLYTLRRHSKRLLKQRPRMKLRNVFKHGVISLQNSLTQKLLAQKIKRPSS